MSPRTVVVDGSNIATEGRQMPSLLQLDEAVRAYREEHPDDDVIVVVDATFAHRIPEEERPMYEEAAAHNELVYPPAGAVGRGDAFLLRVAEKTNAVVLSNDSFQEFHGEHEWLFDKGRLIGGTPVPGVGWIFVARTPVRGPKSREAVKEAKRTRARIGSREASQPMPVPKAPPPGPGRKKGGKKAPVGPAGAEEAIAVATEEAVSGGDGEGKKKRKRRKRRGAKGGEPELATLNEPLTFIEFIAEHKLGTEVEGEVESFASHGAFVIVGDARCYIPLSAMGDPPPRSAREVLNKGEVRSFVVQALDAARRGIELALPGFEHVAGSPTDETVEAEIAEAPEPRHRAAATSTAEKSATKRTAAKKVEPGKAAATKTSTKRTAPKKAAAKKSAAKKTAATRTSATKTAARTTGAEKAAATRASAAKKSTVKKSTVKKSTVKKSTVKKSAVKKAPAAKRATARTTTAKKVVAKKASAKKAPAAKTGAAKKVAGPGKAARRSSGAGPS
ncbi:MAG TPA: histone H1-like repetitive region-containing protein [Acidimicrobiales bacterium]|nr:histone H1-like repetitive region-containing protein [Acidimicrobiales bacterium]